MVEKINAPVVARPTVVAIDEMVERLAFAGCGAKTWPTPYAADYHRAVVRRILNTITLKDLRLIEAMK